MELLNLVSIKISDKLGGPNIPCPGLDTDACANLVSVETCPREAGASTSWQYQIEVLPKYPRVSHMVEEYIMIIFKSKLLLGNNLIDPNWL